MVPHIENFMDRSFLFLYRILRLIDYIWISINETALAFLVLSFHDFLGSFDWVEIFWNELVLNGHEATSFFGEIRIHIEILLQIVKGIFLLTG